MSSSVPEVPLFRLEFDKNADGSENRAKAFVRGGVTLKMNGQERVFDIVIERKIDGKEAPVIGGDIREGLGQDIHKIVQESAQKLQEYLEKNNSGKSVENTRFEYIRTKDNQIRTEILVLTDKVSKIAASLFSGPMSGASIRIDDAVGGSMKALTKLLHDADHKPSETPTPAPSRLRPTPSPEPEKRPPPEPRADAGLKHPTTERPRIRGRNLHPRHEVPKFELPGNAPKILPQVPEVIPEEEIVVFLKPFGDYKSYNFDFLQDEDLKEGLREILESLGKDKDSIFSSKDPEKIQKAFVRFGKSDMAFGLDKEADKAIRENEIYQFIGEVRHHFMNAALNKFEITGSPQKITRETEKVRKEAVLYAFFAIFHLFFENSALSNEEIAEIQNSVRAKFEELRKTDPVLRKIK